MRRATWLLRDGVPVIEIQLTDPFGFIHNRTLLADTGAGPSDAPFQVVLSEGDCKLNGSPKVDFVELTGAVLGGFPIYEVFIEITALNVAQLVKAVAVPAVQLPEGLDGIAAFRLLNSFTYGNFGNSAEFGLETK